MAASGSSKTQDSATPILWAVLLVIAGVVLLLDNFLLLGDFDAARLWPLLLVVAGAQILLRGDLLPSTSYRTFGITRGSVETAVLEINAGEIDVSLRALQREGRLIAGQFAAESRPYLNVDGTHAHLRMDRAGTPWLSFAEWQMGLTGDLPWQIYISTHLGQVNTDLSNLILHDAVIATGIGDIRLTCPREAFGQIYVRSALGNMTLVTPIGYRARIVVERGLRAKADSRRYVEVEHGVFIALDAEDDAPQVELRLRGSFGDAYLV